MGEKSKKIVLSVLLLVVVSIMSAFFSQLLFKKTDIANAQCVPGLSQISCHEEWFDGKGEKYPQLIECAVGEYMSGFRGYSIQVGSKTYIGKIKCCKAY
jgi:hypothetical protein